MKKKKSDDDDDEIYNVNEYSDVDLYTMLDLNNPSDRELEAKILTTIDKYRETDNTSLETFFEDVYSHFFEEDEEDEEEEEEEDDDEKEGFSTQKRTQENNSFHAKNTQVGSTTNAQENPLLLNNNKLAPRQTTNMEYGPSMLNPLLKETQRRVVHIQSKYRDYTTYSRSTDFNFNLSDTLNNVVALRLHSVNIPYKWYNISDVYNTNYFYLKGTSPGVKGVYDFKFEISPGAYTIPDLIEAINASVTKVATQYPEVEFGTTGISYNDNTLKPTLTLDIKNVFTESSYYLHFLTSGSSLVTQENNTTIPGMLGYLNTVQPFYNVYSKFQYALAATGFVGPVPNSYDDQNVFTVVVGDDITPGNNYFTVLNYQGPGEYDVDTSTVLDTITVTYATVGEEYSRSQLIAKINEAITLETRLSIRSDLQSETVSYKTNAGNINSLSQYVLTLHLDPLTTTKSTNMKTVVLFPNETTIITPPIWRGPDSCFLFDEEQLAVHPNHLIGQNPPVQTLYNVTSTPTISYTCTKQYYSDSPLNNMTVSIPTSTSLGFPNGYTMNEYVGIDNGTTQYTNSAINVALTNATHSSNITLDATMRYSIEDQRVISRTSIKTSFNEYDYSLDLTNCILHIDIGFPSTIDITSPDSNVITNTVYYNVPIDATGSVWTTVSGYVSTLPPYIIDNTNNTIVVTPKPLLGNSSVPPYTIQIPTGSYVSLARLNKAINLTFINIRGNRTGMNGLNMSQSKVDITTTLCTFTYKIQTQLTENDYKMELSGTSWDELFGFQSPYYPLSVFSKQTNYAEVIADDIPYTDPSKTITITTTNNRFYMYPFSTMKGIYDEAGTNSITITIPSGEYNVFDLYNEINTQMNENALLEGSFITTYYNGENIEYSQMRVRLNQTYTAQDYELVFFDINNAQLNQIPTNGNLVFEPTKWDLTIGWLLGYHSAPIYNLSPSDPNNSLYVEKNSYFLNTETGVITLTTDTPLDIYLYKDFYIILNDYTQNHLNDGVVTIESIPTTVKRSSTSSLAHYTANAETGTTQVGLEKSNSPSQILSEKRNYAANTINSDNNANASITKTYSDPPYLKDLFALIALKPSSLKRGEIFAEFGGALQENERKYFGPVNIKKMSVQLMNDRGDIIDLHGANWSFSLIAEYLYNQTRI